LRDKKETNLLRKPPEYIKIEIETATATASANKGQIFVRLFLIICDMWAIIHLYLWHFKETGQRLFYPIRERKLYT